MLDFISRTSGEPQMPEAVCEFHTLACVRLNLSSTCKAFRLLRVIGWVQKALLKQATPLCQTYPLTLAWPASAASTYPLTHGVCFSPPGTSYPRSVPNGFSLGCTSLGL